jgi:hypothetical protein
VCQRAALLAVHAGRLIELAVAVFNPSNGAAIGHRLLIATDSTGHGGGRSAMRNWGFGGSASARTRRSHNQQGPGRTGQPAATDSIRNKQFSAAMLGIVDYSGSDSDTEEPQKAGSRQGPAAAQPVCGTTTAAAAAAGRAAPSPASGLPSAAALFDNAAAPGGSMRLPPPNFGQGHPPPAAAGSKRGHPDTRGPLPNPVALDSKVQRRWVLGGICRRSMWLACGFDALARLACWLGACMHAASRSCVHHRPPACVCLLLQRRGRQRGRRQAGVGAGRHAAAAAAQASDGERHSKAPLCCLQLAGRTTLLQQLPHSLCGCAYLCLTLPCPIWWCRGRANVATEDLSSMFTKQSQRAAQQR